MGFRSLISFGMIAIPIGATLGVLLGLDAHRSATGQTPLFQDNSVTTDTYCQKAYGITPPSTGQQYTCKLPLSSKFQPPIQQETGCRPLPLSESAIDERQSLMGFLIHSSVVIGPANLMHAKSLCSAAVLNRIRQ